jgi:hypothetical protein
MLRTFAILWFIINGLVHLVLFALSWDSVQQVFTPPPNFPSESSGWFSSPDRIIRLLWLICVAAVMVLAILGLLDSGVGLARDKAWWRARGIVSAITAMVAMLPWLGLLLAPFSYALLAMDAAIVLAFALPWGDALVQRLQHN